MNKLSKKELKTIIKNHKHWINKDVDGWEKMKADLSNYEMVGLEFNGVDLRRVNFNYSSIKNCNFYKCNLTETLFYDTEFINSIFSYCDLEKSDFSKSLITHTSFYSSSIEKSKFNGANVFLCDFYEVNFDDTTFYHAYLDQSTFRYCNFPRSNFMDATIREQNFYGSRLEDALYIPFIPMTCPEEGEFIGWKKIHIPQLHNNKEYLVKLLIPEDAKRSSATSTKCRCSYAKVLEIRDITSACTLMINMNGKNILHDTTNYKKVNKIINNTAGIETLYESGKFVYPDSYDENRWIECGHGIHFFINKQEAIKY